MEYINSVILESPKSLSELYKAVKRNPDSVLFAGGTYIMSRPGYFPKKNLHGYISLSEIPELHRVLHSDKYLELGSMVTIQGLLNASASSLSKPIYKAIGSIAPSVLRNLITIGGALCSMNCRTNLCCILCAINASAEVRFITRNNKTNLNNIKTKARWIPVAKLYDSDGRYLYSDNAVLTRVRIPSDPTISFIYNNVGSLTTRSESAVTLAFQYNMNQNSIINPSFCLSFLNNGIFNLQDFEGFLRSVKFPLSNSLLQKIAGELLKLLRTECTNITDLQRERAIRLMIDALETANREYYNL